MFVCVTSVRSGAAWGHPGAAGGQMRRQPVAGLEVPIVGTIRVREPRGATTMTRTVRVFASIR